LLDNDEYKSHNNRPFERLVDSEQPFDETLCIWHVLLLFLSDYCDLTALEYFLIKGSNFVGEDVGGGERGIIATLFGKSKNITDVDRDLWPVECDYPFENIVISVQTNRQNRCVWK
jgi:hypothetical protein